MNDTKPTTSTEKAEAVRLYARQTTGTENHYRALFGLTHTDGARYLAEVCGAYWLLDAIGSHQMTRSVRAEEFQLWDLRRDDSRGTSPTQGWVLSCWRDTPGEGRPLVRQEIEYSDFPPELSPFKLYCENRTILLPEER